MLNRLISLVFFLLILNIYPVYSETSFLFPQKKPSIFKKSEKEIQQSINKNLPVPKPTLQKKETTKTTNIEKKKDPIIKEKTDEKKIIKSN